MKRKRSSGLDDSVVENIVKERRKYRLVDAFLRLERIYETGDILRKRLRNHFGRAVFEILDTGRKKGRVLDLGTPFGICGAEIAKQTQDFDIVSLQESKKYAEIARKFAEDDLARMEWVVGRPENIPFSKETFDLIVSSFDMHTWDDPSRALKETQRVLKKRGSVVILDVRRDRWWLIFLPSLFCSWLIAGFWLFRKIRFAFKSSYKPNEMQKILDSLRAEGWEVREGLYYFLVRKG